MVVFLLATHGVYGGLSYFGLVVKLWPNWRLDLAIIAPQNLDASKKHCLACLHVGKTALVPTKHETQVSEHSLIPEPFPLK